MEALFDLIFGNIGFLIVIIGGVISFFKRANENQNKKQQPKDKRVKPFIPQLEDLFGEITKHIEEQPQKQKPTVFKTDKRIPENKTKLEAEELEPTGIHTYERLNDIKNTKLHNKIEVEHQKIDIDIKDINRKKVIEGVIWGEILGPPRARKKHSYSYLKRG